MPSCAHRSDGAEDCGPRLGSREEGGRGCRGGEGRGVPSWAIGVHAAGVTSRLCQCCGPGEGQNRGDTPAGLSALNRPLVPCERLPRMRCEHHGGLTSGGRSNAWGRGRDLGCPPELAAGVLGTPEAPPPPPREQCRGEGRPLSPLSCLSA